MISIQSNDPRLKYPGFYNIYPIQNEISIHSKINGKNLISNELIIDDYYGRILRQSIMNSYGATDNLSNYISFEKYNIVDELRVPFRRIPIFAYESVNQIKLIMKKIINDNPNYEILIRGQSNIYTINREREENMFLFGEANPKEPSFLPSFLRSNFNEIFVSALWHSELAFILNDIGVDLNSTLSKAERNIYWNDVSNIKRSFHYTPMALGIAQHYGLPSVGLDLTKDISVATWFASHKMRIQHSGDTNISRIEKFEESTLYIFRCPKEAVFSHERIKPKFINNTRPDRQDAWFSHVGWGHAKNQLASFLVCGIRLNESIFETFKPNFEHYLFPDRTQDAILDYFLTIKQNKKYSGEVARAFSRIYFLE